MTHYDKSAANTVKRGQQKAHYDKATIHAILDSAEMCHVAFLIDGEAHTQPINFGRDGETIYLHGALQNRMTSAILQTGKVNLSVTHLDAMKLARSAFHHSVNYRSASIFGTVKEITDNAQKIHGLKTIINHFIPHRWDYCRPPNDKELNATRVLAIEMNSAVAKVANTPVNDNKKDYLSDYWAGIVPVKTVVTYPIGDATLPENMTIPEHVLAFYEQYKNGF